MSRPSLPAALSPIPAPARRSGGDDPVAIVTGANHGIGAATARTLAAAGARVLVTGLPLDEERDPATPDLYYEARARSAEGVAAAIRDAGGRASAVDLDLAGDDAAAILYDAAEQSFDAPYGCSCTTPRAGSVTRSPQPEPTTSVAGSAP